MNVLEKVVAVDRCIGCGVCAGLCPHGALAMGVLPSGDLSAVAGPGPCRPGCRLCLEACPFESGVHDPRRLNVALHGGAVRFADEIGHFARCLSGSRSDPALRAAAASGGLVGWTLETLLERRLVSRVAVLRWAGRGREAPRFEFFSARSIDEVRASAGTMYAPVELSGVVREILDGGDERWAVVGVPCLCAAIRGNRTLSRRVPFVLGLACGQYQNGFYTELLADRSGVSPGALAGARFRVKEGGRAPDDYGFQALGADGRWGAVVHYKGLPVYLGRAAFFRQNACNYCMDVFAEAADACFMDAWLPRFARESRGTSLVVVRDPTLDRLLEEGRGDGTITTAPIAPEDVVRSQRGHVRRKRILIRLRTGEIPAGVRRPWTWYDRLEWGVQRRAQARSKAVWAALGPTAGFPAFWRAMRGTRMQVALLRPLASVERRLARLRRRLGHDESDGAHVKTILLIGIHGVYNYGCEAIVRGTADALRGIWPGARIRYASPRPDDDRRRLEGAGVEVVRRRPMSRFAPAHLLRKLAAVFGAPRARRGDALSLLDDVDGVVSIGGDIYTLTERNGFNPTLAMFGDAALRRRIPYVLWGASVGPFRANPNAERFYRRHLSRVSLVAAREPRTVAYLEGLGVAANVRSCVDPAFFVAPEIRHAPRDSGDGCTIGINLSPLSLAYAGVAVNEGIRGQAAAVERIVERFGAKVVLVPHVLCDFNEADDDLRHLRSVREAVGESLRGRVELLEGDPGFVGTKRVLATCDLVVAARMHCAINALAACVPTIFLAYSEKAKGMSELVYGNQEHLLPVEEFRDGGRLLDVVAAALAARGPLHAQLVARMDQLRDPGMNPALGALRALDGKGNAGA